MYELARALKKPPGRSLAHARVPPRLTHHPRQNPLGFRVPKSLEETNLTFSHLLNASCLPDHSRASADGPDDVCFWICPDVMNEVCLKKPFQPFTGRTFAKAPFTGRNFRGAVYRADFRGRAPFTERIFFGRAVYRADFRKGAVHRADFRHGAVLQGGRSPFARQTVQGGRAVDGTEPRSTGRSVLHLLHKFYRADSADVNRAEPPLTDTYRADHAATGHRQTGAPVDRPERRLTDCLFRPLIVVGLRRAGAKRRRRGKTTKGKKHDRECTKVKE